MKAAIMQTSFTRITSCFRRGQWMAGFSAAAGWGVVCLAVVSVVVGCEGNGTPVETDKPETSAAQRTDGTRQADGTQKADATETVREQGKASQVADSFQQTLTLTGHTDSVLSVAFRPDGQRLAYSPQSAGPCAGEMAR